MQRHSWFPSREIGRLLVCLIAATNLASVFAEQPSLAAATSLYGVFEQTVRNSKYYSNPFDFRVIELHTEFTAPSGKKSSFFGFFDGDGKGGQDGDIWKFRFMPTEVGNYRYTFSWSDGTAGGAGSFQVADTGLAGPLRVASDNPWYFMTSRHQPFHARPYGMHNWLTWTKSHRMAAELEAFKLALKTKVVDRGYNMVMWPDMGDRLQQGASSSPDGNLTDSWWQDTRDTRRFSIASFRANEEALAFCRENGVYVFTFSGMIDQQSQYDLDDFRGFLRYFVARMAPFYNYFGWSPVWEWMDIWRPHQVTEIMQYVHDIDPWKRLLTAHDNSHSSFTGWLGFSMRQAPSDDVFKRNSRRAGQQQIADRHGSGGVGDPFIDKPILGSEDQWESPVADNYQNWSVPRNGLEAMRSSWGTLMAGVIPLYDEWNAWTRRPPGNGQGEPHVRRMFDFWYLHTKYRRYRQLNELVSREQQQVASGVPGEEYLVYDQDGGSINMNLSDEPTSSTFDVLWFDPATGVERTGEAILGGTGHRLESPFSGDSVLLLKRRAN